MSEWITDRAPVESDAHHGYVWFCDIDGHVSREPWKCVLMRKGTAWMPITPPEPYVKAKRWGVRENGAGERNARWYVVELETEIIRCMAIPTREAAERIAAIYEEVMP